MTDSSKQPLTPEDMKWAQDMALMVQFIKSGIPKYGKEVPFTLTPYETPFQALEWWNVEEYMTIAVALTNPRNLLLAIMTMHDYIVNQWQEAAANYVDKKPEFPSHDFEFNGETRTSSEYYNLTSMQSFGYSMALIVPENLIKELGRYHFDMIDFEVFVVKPSGFAGLLQSPTFSDETED